MTPALSVTFRPSPADRMRYFGPYLGGLRVQHAVCVLNRLLPLSYTAARLGGAENDLACVRGVAGDDRVALIGSLTAVLDRRGELGHKSAAAVAGPRSQRPGVRVRRPRPGRDRGAGLDQLPAAGPQHGRCEPHDLGLVRRHAGPIPVRDGRLRSWWQRPCSLASAAPALAATLAAWTDFAQRNAEPVASLAQSA